MQHGISWAAVIKNIHRYQTLSETRINNKNVAKVWVVGCLGGGWIYEGVVGIKQGGWNRTEQNRTVQDRIGQEHITHTLRLIIGYLSADKRNKTTTTTIGVGGNMTRTVATTRVLWAEWAKTEPPIKKKEASWRSHVLPLSRSRSRSLSSVLISIFLCRAFDAQQVASFLCFFFLFLLSFILFFLFFLVFFQASKLLICCTSVCCIIVAWSGSQHGH